MTMPARCARKITWQSLLLRVITGNFHFLPFGVGLAARFSEYAIATACLIGFPALTSAFTLARKAAKDLDFTSGILLPLHWLGNDDNHSLWLGHSLLFVSSHILFTALFAVGFFLYVFFTLFKFGSHHLPFFADIAGLAVLAESLNALAVGALGAPGLRIFSLEPAAMRSCLAWILAYKPGFVAMINFLPLHRDC